MVIIDTNIFIWSVLLPKNAPSWVEGAVKNRDNLYFSVINLIEISIKQSKGKLTKIYSPSQLYEYMLLSNAKFLNLSPRTTEILASLPPHHRDPFDRLLIAQAIEHSAPLITADPIFKKYDVKLIGI